MKYISLSPELRALTGSKKKKCFLQFLTSPKVRTASFWDGGSRDTFVVHNIKTGQNKIPPAGTFPHYSDAYYEMCPFEVLIQSGTFCGRPAAPTVKMTPETWEQFKNKFKTEILETV